MYFKAIEHSFRIPEKLKQQNEGWFSLDHKGLPNFGMTVTNGKSSIYYDVYDYL